MITYEPKYDRDLDIVEIAKLLRAEIKAAVKAEELPKGKYSVRISRYANGRSLNVTIKDYPGTIYNRRRLKLAHEIDQGCLGEAGRARHRDLWDEHADLPKYTEELVDLIKALEKLVDQWNYDGSDLQIDYFNVNYYSHVNIDCEQADAEWERVTAEIKAADGLRIFDPEAA